MNNLERVEIKPEYINYYSKLPARSSQPQESVKQNTPILEPRACHSPNNQTRTPPAEDKQSVKAPPSTNYTSCSRDVSIPPSEPRSQARKPDVGCPGTTSCGKKQDEACMCVILVI